MLAGARGEPLSATALVQAAELLGVSGNAMRIALSRLAATGDAETKSRGLYELGRVRRAALAHVHMYKSGFAPRVRWLGGFCGVFTAHLSRRENAVVRRRERALALTGFRELVPGLYVRPDNLAGGRAQLARHLGELGLDEAAEQLGLALDADQQRRLQQLYDVAGDQKRARALHAEIDTLLAASATLSPRKFAAATFWLGDEVLRFLARDPLLPEDLADPAARSALAEAMARLDQHAYALWRSLLSQFEATSHGRP